MRSITTTVILFAGVLAMIFPAHQAVNGQIFLSNEVPPPEYYQQIQHQQQIDPSFMSFEQFMKYMFYYKEMFGQDYVTKIYKEYHNDDDDDDDDDDNDNDDKKKKYHKDWWKHNSGDLWKDKKKYCEGKGEFKNGKCVTDNEEDKTAWEDAVCDNSKKKSKFCNGNANKDDKDDDDKKDDTTDSIEEANEKLNYLFNDNDENDSSNNDVKEQEEEQEEDEPEEQEESEEESEEDDSSDDDGGDDEGGSDEEE